MSSPSQTPSGAPPPTSPLFAFLNSPDFAAMLSGDIAWGDVPHEPRAEVPAPISPFRDFSALATGIPASMAFGAPNPREWREMRAAEETQEAKESYIQAALDSEWENANHAGPGCPFCDAIFSCNCWEERREMHEAEERRRVRAERAAIAAAVARGDCYCSQLEQDDDYPMMCEICEREESLRCTGCGQLKCRPGCCGGCGDCDRCAGPECRGCGRRGDCWCGDDREEDRESCGCGACEEHRSWGDGGW